MLMGSNVAETVQGGIVDVALFQPTPDLFMFGEGGRVGIKEKK